MLRDYFQQSECFTIKIWIESAFYRFYIILFNKRGKFDKNLSDQLMLIRITGRGLLILLDDVS
jgi:hypothetical protein